MALNLNNLHVLIVEDISPMRDLTTAVLKAQGIGKVSYAADGEKGFEAFCHLNPDIVLTDWQMPIMTGMDMVKLIRTHSRSPNKMVPIIMMTGFGSPTKISSARDSGVTEFLVKPFSAKDLSKRILHIIAQPRDFIATDKYKGPDRRRKSNPTALAFSGKDLRTTELPADKKIKANHVLQAKVGYGVVDEEKLTKSQSIIDKNTFNFAPVAYMFLGQLNDGLEIAKNEQVTNRRSIDRLINPVMQIKANARIFKYDLLGNLANIMLNFLERLNELDKDSIEIVDAHKKTLTHIVSSEMKGNGGSMGSSLETELDAACTRYMNTRISRQKEKMMLIMGDESHKQQATS